MWYSPIGGKVYVTQWFGERPEVYKRFGLAGHNGLDFRTKFSNTPKGWRYFYAVADGIVSKVKYSQRGYGNEVRLRLDTGEEIVYGHAKSISVKKGQRVKGGAILGITNNTGFSSASHLHFGIRPQKPDAKNGYDGWLNPMRHGYLENGLIDPESGKRLAWQGRAMAPVETSANPSSSYKALYEAERKRREACERKLTEIARIAGTT